MGQGTLATLVGVILMATSSALATTTAPGAAPGATSGATGGGIGDYWWAIVVLLVIAAAIWYYMKAGTGLSRGRGKAVRAGRRVIG